MLADARQLAWSTSGGALRSYTFTLKPLRARYMAAQLPAGPAPMTTASWAPLHPRVGTPALSTARAGCAGTACHVPGQSYDELARRAGCRRQGHSAGTPACTTGGGAAAAAGAFCGHRRFEEGLAGRAGSPAAAAPAPLPATAGRRQGPCRQGHLWPSIRPGGDAPLQRALHASCLSRLWYALLIAGPGRVMMLGMLPLS